MIPCELSWFRTVPDPSMQVMWSELQSTANPRAGKAGGVSITVPTCVRGGQEGRGCVKDFQTAKP